MDRVGEVLECDVAGLTPYASDLQVCEITVGAKRGVITVTGAMYVYQQLKRSDRDGWETAGVHRVDNTQLFVERAGEIIDDAVVANTWRLTAGRRMPISRERIMLTVSAEWFAVVDGDHKMTFSGRRPTTPLDGWRK